MIGTDARTNPSCANNSDTLSLSTSRSNFHKHKWKHVYIPQLTHTSTLSASTSCGTSFSAFSNSSIEIDPLLPPSQTNPVTIKKTLMIHEFIKLVHEFIEHRHWHHLLVSVNLAEELLESGFCD
jgi:hypothetical protein